MADVIADADMIDRLIAHAQEMLDEDAYDWPTSREALGGWPPTSRRARSAIRASGGCASTSRKGTKDGMPAEARQNDAGAARDLEER